MGRSKVKDKSKTSCSQTNYTETSNSNSADSSQSDMESKAKLQFKNICNEIEYFKTKIEDCDISDQNRVRVLKNKLTDLEKRLNEVFSELSVEENKEQFETLMQFRDVLVELSVELENKSTVNKEINSNSVENISHSKSENSQIKLPKLEIPYFYGVNESWISFKELFNSSILSNENLSDIQKLQYLQSCVRGNAAKLIRGFSLKSENLKNCWEILCNRYENKRKLALAQINKIFSMKVNKVDDAESFLQLIDTCNESVRNLKTLGLESNALSDLVFINFMVSKLQPGVRQRWELSLEKGDHIPNLELFRSFMEKEANGIMGVTKPDSKYFKKPEFTTKKASVSFATLTKENKCLACFQMHPLHQCVKFNSMNVKDRWKFVKNKSLCENCLRDNHNLQSCKINVNCKSCAGRHHTLLHVYSVNSTNQGSENVSLSVVNSARGCSGNLCQNVLLATALVKIKSDSGKTILCRALIDNASQNTLISKSCADKLKLSLSDTKHRLVGINGIIAETCLHSTVFKLAPYFNNQFKSIKALVVEKVTTPLPNFRLERREWPHTKKLMLADPDFFKTKPVDLLIGADQFTTLLTGTPIHGQSGQPSALPTILGHILMGPTLASTNVNQNYESVFCHSLNLEQFFEVESVPEKCNEVYDKAEIMFQNTTKRTSSGRYIVKLPFTDDVNLGESANHALNIFYSVERKLESNPDLKKQYVEFMDEYYALNHMELVAQNEIDIKPNFYLPHHSVINHNSSTTKLRVVFNASAPSTNGNSLNSVLLKGPKLQTSIFFNLIKFRQYKIALTADITKMYRQILVAEEDTHFQRIFWRKNKTDPLLVYKLKTVTYGENCAPFLALRTIKQLCEDEKEHFPLAATIANDHFYVDDFLGGADSDESAAVILHEMQLLMNSGGFELRKWSSNNQSILQNLPEHLKASSFLHEFTTDHSQKILGLEWNCKNDSLQVLVSERENVKTKRQLLSVIARIYDPLGLLSPCTLILKILLQEVWKAKVAWDESLPINIQERWDKFNSEINSLRTVAVPRFLKLCSLAKIEIHGFCDASTQAYAAVVYLRVISNTVSVSLVAAKTRIAPVKLVTLPKLELCGALLLSELVHAVQETLNSTPEVFLWTDSTIALSWILRPPDKSQQFVTHRVAKINNLTPSHSWHHIPGKLNIADCASRGLYPKQLKLSTDWWSGPPWLYEFSGNHSSGFPVMNAADTSIPVGEPDLVCQANPHFDILEKVSTFTKLLRIVAWIKRFVTNVRSNDKIKGPLSASEINQACKVVVKNLQNIFFSTEIDCLKRKKSLNKSSQLISLNVFLDNEGILRVGGRLSHHQTLNYDTKHPMLLPKRHNVTSAIIRYYHAQCMHGGSDLVLSLIRQRFWIIEGRSAVKKELRQCFRCARFSAQPIHQLMGNLPAVRITPSRTYENVGVDFAGPINTKCQHGRRFNTFKSYLCLFICMSTKAVHLELVSELTTAAFLLALRRFISRRGCPKEIFSDNGKNFVGAAAHLKQIYNLLKESTIQDFATTHQITWRFMPPYGPNFGGLWESAIKLAKRHLFKTCQGTLFNFEELMTVLCLIEACINSRPLTALSTDPNDLSALTPGHFIIGAPLLTLPDHITETNPSLSLFSRWKLLLECRAKFWKQWTRDYLHTLTSRNKWRSEGPILKPGQLVLLKQPHLIPTQWCLARIVNTHPGQDGVIRVVTVRTSEGLYKRPVQQIALLPDVSCSPARGGYGKKKEESRMKSEKSY